jgi:acid phosphatase (class A)
MKYNQTVITRHFSFNHSLWLAPILFSLAVTIMPLRAADDTMAQPTAAVQTTELHYLTGKKPNASELLAPPPQPGSPEQDADMAEVQAVYHATGSNDMAAAYSEKKFDIFNFTPAIGDFFVAGKFPKTKAFFVRVQTDAETVTDKAKDFYQRPRPYVTDPTLANGKLEKSFSYPSGHSTESMVLALTLADVFPDKRDALVAHARLIGWHRVEIARHYPTDIYAGRVLAQAIVKQMEKSDSFQKDLADVKAEIAAAQK